jgi:predicted GH43/DUF377 family glycosyl hydrolase
MASEHAPLFTRHPNNPILTAADWPYPAHTVFNAGATRLADGTTLLLCRVEDKGVSRIFARRDRATEWMGGRSILSQRCCPTP